MGEVCVLFSKDEIVQSTFPFRFSLVLKFLRQHPSLDAVRAFIQSRWGLQTLPMVSLMLRPRNVFIRLTSEEDFVKAFAREACDIERINYRVF